MANNYGIPAETEAEIMARDVVCAYCRKEMVDPKSTPDRTKWATIEHLNHLPTSQFQYPKTAEYFVMACQPCNSSRRDKPLAAWVAEKRIADIVAPVVKAYLTRPEASIPIDAALAAIDALAAHQRRLSRQRRRPEAALAIAA
jgi:hypothetical protein